MKARSQTPSVEKDFFSWGQASPLPDADGLAGSFAGTSGGALLLAGGTNFPGNQRPWTGGTKTWYDKIYVLERPGGAWKEAGRLPRALGYGISISGAGGLICLGGGDAQREYADAFILQYQAGRISTQSLPPLPEPLVNGCGVILQHRIFVLAPGGAFWSLDLSASLQKWEILPSMPGPSRILAAAGAGENEVYIFGGVHLKDSAGTREYLKDCWKYQPGKGWGRVADLPHPLAAAPTPAYQAGQNHLVLFGGDDGSRAALTAILKDNHPGFTNGIVAFNTITGAWSMMGGIPVEKKTDAADNPHGSTYAPVTTPLVVWNGQVVLPGGEARPGVRSNKVLTASPRQPSGKFGALDWTVIACYFALVIGISVWVSRNMGKTTGDFFLGGQKIPWWAAGLSIFGSKLSALTFIAIPAKAYATDWTYIMNNVMIVAIAPIVTFFYLPYFRKLKLTSVYEYLRIRFDSRVKFLGSLTFVIFQLSRLGVVIYLPALVLSTVTGINIFACILLTTLITTAYSVAGGIEAVVWTEVMQVFVLLGGALASFFFITAHTHGGFSGLLQEAFTNDKFRVANLGWSISQPVLWVVAIGALLTNLVTYTSDQVVVQRYLTTATEKEARRSIYTNALMVIPASVIFFGVGTALWFFYRHHPGELNPNGRIDDVFPWFISQQLPAGLSGLVIAGLFAATMSTISSSMNSIATVVTTDFYKALKKGASDRQCLKFARLFTILLGTLGCGIACYLVYLQNASIWDQYLKIIGLFGGCLAGMFAAGIFFPRINSRGILAGFVLSCIGLYFLQRSGAVSFFLYPLFAVAGCLFFGYLFSLRKFILLLLPILFLSARPVFAQAPNLNYIFQSGQDGYSCFRIPALITTRQGAILAFAEGRKNNCGDAGDIDLVVRRSTDGGNTWGPLRVVWDDSANTCGNPAPVVDETTGAIILLSTWNLGADKEKAIVNSSSADTRRVFVLTSGDEGLTWSAPTEITGSVKQSNWTWYATGPGRGLQISGGRKKGRLVVPCNHMEASTKRNNAHVIWSDDHGKTWVLGGVAQDSTNESTLAELSNGRLMLNMRNTGKTRYRQIAISKNAGKNWMPQPPDTTLVEPVCEGNLLAFHSADRQHGLAFSNPASAAARIAMTVRVSFDDGRTWLLQKLLYEGPSAYSCLAMLPDGNLACLYEAGKQRPYEGIVFEEIPWTEFKKQE
ncbi:sodium/solute symporter [Flavitalea sp. BT771]|uniref:sodium:solute symporter family transporter n=1 Tax=Flavitalea sp. BT771 TaxID=3063329 RepID=UPI0026E11644|nr:sodium/solute symporter [Flavitalea sp. BT771]MDO6431504.1 sodium/solute symporter [Flavitalea sp. BT771]MDV6220412.1 sodium/solute symporter [Flavitalea sp. BT771]